MADRYTLLANLPQFGNKWELVNKSQEVNDIINELLNAHNSFSGEYDLIYSSFYKNDVAEICRSLYSFCKKNIKYNQETEDKQTSKSPAGILSHGYGDCKHYASFCGGILNAITRNTGKKINWNYRFASYSAFAKTPEHVFIVVKNNGKEIWIDPTPGADKVTPVWQIDKKINVMPLYRVSGIGQANYPAIDLLNSLTDADLEAAISILLKYGVMDMNAKVNDKVLLSLQGNVDLKTYNDLVNARQLIEQAAIGGLFSNIWRGVKKVALIAPRNAYLALVGINAFGYATKLHNALFNADGSYTAFKEKLYDVWHNKLAGDFSKLQNTIADGYRKKAILGAAPAIPVWVGVASAIIAAIMPLVKSFLDAKKQQTGIDYNNVNPETGLPYGQDLPTTNGNAGGDIMNWVKENPLLIAGGAVGIYLLMKNKRA